MPGRKPVDHVRKRAYTDRWTFCGMIITDGPRMGASIPVPPSRVVDRPRFPPKGMCARCIRSWCNENNVSPVTGEAR